MSSVKLQFKLEHEPKLELEGLQLCELEKGIKLLECKPLLKQK